MGGFSFIQIILQNSLSFPLKNQLSVKKTKRRGSEPYGIMEIL